MDNIEVTETESNEQGSPLKGDYLPAGVRQHVFTDLQQLADFIILTKTKHGELQSGIDRIKNKKVYLLQLK